MEIGNPRLHLEYDSCRTSHKTPVIGVPGGGFRVTEVWALHDKAGK